MSPAPVTRTELGFPGDEAIFVPFINFTMIYLHMLHMLRYLNTQYIVMPYIQLL